MSPLSPTPPPPPPPTHTHTHIHTHRSSKRKDRTPSRSPSPFEEYGPNRTEPTTAPSTTTSRKSKKSKKEKKYRKKPSPSPSPSPVQADSGSRRSSSVAGGDSSDMEVGGRSGSPPRKEPDSESDYWSRVFPFSIVLEHFSLVPRPVWGLGMRLYSTCLHRFVYIHLYCVYLTVTIAVWLLDVWLYNAYTCKKRFHFLLRKKFSSYLVLACTRVKTVATLMSY